MKTKDNFIEGAKVTQDNQIFPSKNKNSKTKGNKADREK
jgi:hypothetical protein